jgi:hypothetical protein
MRQWWTTTERRELTQSYAAEGAAALATRLGRSIHAVCSQARRYGIRSSVRRFRQGRTRAQSSPTVNAQFFDDTTPEVSFVLGFIWACGSVRTKHRHILRLVCYEDRVERLQIILDILQSRHQLQRYGNRLVVELGNHRLVQTLIERFGKPPGKDSEGTLPRLPGSMVPLFASGHLFATGVSNPQSLRWQGHPQVVSWLVEQVQAALPITEPRVSRWGQTLSAAWTNPGEIQEIRQWLENPETGLTRL